MTVDEWTELQNFGVDEKDAFGRPITAKIEVINPELMARLDWVVTYAKQEFGPGNGAFIVNCITLGAHSHGSQHYLGRAVDGYFKGLTLYEMVMLGFKAGFTGIGYYLDWNIPGVHLDIRENGVATWLRDYEYFYDFTYFTGRLLDRSA